MNAPYRHFPIVVAAGRRLALLLVASSMVSLCAASARMEDGIVGSWGGTISAGEFRFSASATFSASGTYRITAASLSSSGTYRVSGSSITLSPSSPPGFSATTMALSLSGDGQRATITGSVLGLHGTLNLERRKPAAEKNPLPGVWLAHTDDAEVTLELYASGHLYWRESYEKSANARTLTLLREGILDNTITCVREVLEIIDSRPLVLVFAGTYAGKDGEFTVSPLGDMPSGAPGLFGAPTEADRLEWTVSLEEQSGSLRMTTHAGLLVFSRTGDTPPKPDREEFVDRIRANE